MFPNPFLAAGLFDNPWVFIALILISGVANWLGKLRAKNSDGEKPGEGKPAAPPPMPAVDWETRMRRLLGEEVIMVPPPQVPVQPHPAASAPGRGLPPIISASSRSAPPPLSPPVVQVTPTGKKSGGVKRAIQRYEERREAEKLPVRVNPLRGQRRANALGMSLRNPQTARQAFAASLVFGPPKGLEG